MSDHSNIDNTNAPQMAATDRVSEAWGTESVGAPSVLPVLGPVMAQTHDGGIVPDLTLLRLEELLNLGLTGNGSSAGLSLDAGSLQSLLENAELPADLTSLDMSLLLELVLSGAQLPTILEVLNLPGQDHVNEFAETIDDDGEDASLTERAQAGDHAETGGARNSANSAADLLLDEKNKDDDELGSDNDFDQEAFFDGNGAPEETSDPSPSADDSPSNSGQGGSGNVGQGNDGDQGGSSSSSENAQADGGYSNGQGNGPGSNNGHGGGSQANSTQASSTLGGNDQGNGPGINNGQGGGAHTEIASASNAGGNSANVGGGGSHSNAGGNSDHDNAGNSGNGSSAIVLASLGFPGAGNRPADLPGSATPDSIPATAVEAAPPVHAAKTFVASSDVAPGNSAFGRSHGPHADDETSAAALPPAVVAPDAGDSEIPAVLPEGILVKGGGDADMIVGSAGDDLLKGRAGADTIQGFGGDDTLIGNSGGDLLDGGAGADALFGGGGADTLVWDFADLIIDGGRNSDTLRVDGVDADIASFIASGGNIEDIEQVDLRGGGENELTLTYEDVLEMTDNDDALTVFGDADDVLSAGGGWTYDGLDGAGYHVFSQGNESNSATLIVDPEMATVLV